MKYDVIIIGAGPGGIFSAYELMKQRPELKTAVFEAGNPLEKRKCPIDGVKVKSCIKCSTCAIMNGFGGAGAFSDGKYNITNDFGGTLYEYIGREQALSLMRYVDEINVENGGEGTRMYSTAGSSFKKLCMQNKLTLLDASVRHLGTDINYVVLQNLYEAMKDHVDFRFNTPVRRVVPLENGGFRVVWDTGEEECRYCIASVGRSGSKWMETICHDLDIGCVKEDGKHQFCAAGIQAFFRAVQGEQRLRRKHCQIVQYARRRCDRAALRRSRERAQKQ